MPFQRWIYYNDLGLPNIHITCYSSSSPTQPMMIPSKKETRRQKAFAVAHNDYEKKMNVYAFFKVGNRAIGEELVQDTFMKTWKYLVKGGEIETMKAFLYHILNNLIVDEYRKHKTTSLDVLREKGFEPSAKDPENIPDAIDGKAALLLIKLLPKKFRKVMHMRYAQDLSLKEISLINGRSKNSNAVSAHRGLEKLKLLYGT